MCCGHAFGHRLTRILLVAVARLSSLPSIRRTARFTSMRTPTRGAWLPGFSANSSRPRLWAPAGCSEGEREEGWEGDQQGFGDVHRGLLQREAAVWHAHMMCTYQHIIETVRRCSVHQSWRASSVSVLVGDQCIGPGGRAGCREQQRMANHCKAVSRWSSAASPTAGHAWPYELQMSCK